MHEQPVFQLWCLKQKLCGLFARSRPPHPRHPIKHPFLNVKANNGTTTSALKQPNGTLSVFVQAVAH
jgi:hypothetical protein